MISIAAALLAQALLFSPQYLPATFNKGGGGGGGTLAYTGQNCTGGAGSAGTTSTCTATLTASTGDMVVAFGTIGLATATISSCSTATGSASVTWTVVTAASNVSATSEGEVEGACVGNVTSGGTVEPRITWSASGSDNSIVAADFSGSTTHTTDGGNATNNAGTTTTNGIVSGTITTTVNGDMLVSGTADVDGSAATLTAGTTLAFTKIACTTAWGGQTCLEYFLQTTAAPSTQATWTSSAADRNLTALVAVKP